MQGKVELDILILIKDALNALEKPHFQICLNMSLNKMNMNQK